MDEVETGMSSKSPTPLDSPRGTGPKLPARGKPAPAAPPKLPTRAPAPDLEPVDDAEPAAWAEEMPARKGGVGPVGLIVAAVLLMAVVYFGATLLMK
jgi:hypothetical protein